MPPRKQAAIAADPFRRDLLSGFQVTEREIRQLCELELQDALWRIGHEKRQHQDWAARRAAFLVEEVRKAHRARPRPVGVVASVVEFVQPHLDQPRGVKLT